MSKYDASRNSERGEYPTDMAGGDWPSSLKAPEANEATMHMTKRPLQIVSYFLALIPIVTGFIGLLGTDDPLYAGVSHNVLLDTNLRFFGGFWLAMGFAMFWAARRIETETALFRALWAAIFVGGFGRIISMLVVAPPPAPFVAFTVLELVGAPFFIWWQARISKTRAPDELSGPRSPAPSQVRGANLG